MKTGRITVTGPPPGLVPPRTRRAAEWSTRGWAWG